MQYIVLPHPSSSQVRKKPTLIRKRCNALVVFFFVGSEFGATHLISKANDEDAKNKAKALATQLHNHDPRHHYRVKQVDLELQKVGTTEYWYISLQKCEFTNI